MAEKSERPIQAADGARVCSKTAPGSQTKKEEKTQWKYWKYLTARFFWWRCGRIEVKFLGYSFFFSKFWVKKSQYLNYHLIVQIAKKRLFLNLKEKPYRHRPWKACFSRASNWSFFEVSKILTKKHVKIRNKAQNCFFGV